MTQGGSPLALGLNAVAVVLSLAAAVFFVRIVVAVRGRHTSGAGGGPGAIGVFAVCGLVFLFLAAVAGARLYGVWSGAATGP